MAGVAFGSSQGGLGLPGREFGDYLNDGIIVFASDFFSEEGNKLDFLVFSMTMRRFLPGIAVLGRWPVRQKHFDAVDFLGSFVGDSIDSCESIQSQATFRWLLTVFGELTNWRSVDPTDNVKLSTLAKAGASRVLSFLILPRTDILFGGKV